jgi:hypothetical protein
MEFRRNDPPFILPLCARTNGNLMGSVRKGEILLYRDQPRDSPDNFRLLSQCLVLHYPNPAASCHSVMFQPLAFSFPDLLCFIPYLIKSVSAETRIYSAHLRILVVYNLGFYSTIIQFVISFTSYKLVQSHSRSLSLSLSEIKDN